MYRVGKRSKEVLQWIRKRIKGSKKMVLNL